MIARICLGALAFVTPIFSRRDRARVFFSLPLISFIPNSIQAPAGAQFTVSFYCVGSAGAQLVHGAAHGCMYLSECVLTKSNLHVLTKSYHKDIVFVCSSPACPVRACSGPSVVCTTLFIEVLGDHHYCSHDSFSFGIYPSQCQDEVQFSEILTLLVATLTRSAA